METLEKRIELQSNIARTLWENWVVNGCKKPLKLKFHYGSIICFYNGNSEFKFIQRSGYGTGKDLDTFNNLSDAINEIANRGGWLGCKDVYQLS